MEFGLGLFWGGSVVSHLVGLGCTFNRQRRRSRVKHFLAVTAAHASMQAQRPAWQLQCCLVSMCDSQRYWSIRPVVVKADTTARSR